MEIKYCSCCGEYKAKEHFPFNRNRADKLHTYCKRCKKQKNIESRRLSREKRRNYRRYGQYMLDEEIKNLVDQGVLRSGYGYNSYPKTRQEAKAQGLKYYYTGKPCKNNHMDWRRTSDSMCVSCRREVERRYRGE